MTLFVNQTKSYTLTVSSETGEVKILLADDLKERLKEMAADADTNADMVAGLLDAMGDDAAEYLAVAGDLAGIGGTLADTLAKGGTDAVIEAIADMKGDAFEGSKGVRDRAADSSLFSEFADLVAERDQDRRQRMLAFVRAA
ncbi:hypothetical protein KUL25_01670 [Rhodobacteraceae bacterium N5(2021)]|uniref:Uncharacterized protein n=1 Tax=Gymnodinialimonas phycosphaerae TaxID=2841589 RepID=A0A975TVQ0_9RHOB|nr:hypothetical protein [Gymnodinialimonas phycosphaerae]MBY4891468.1 hypothetical protein [Gymnodinialimonas phycosphaerae]